MIPKRSTRSSSPYSLKDLSIRNFNVQGAVLTVILSMIVLVPLVSGTDYLQNFGKPLVFEVLGCILLALLVSQISFGPNTVDSLKKRLFLGPTIPIILLVVYVTVLYFALPTAREYELSSRAEVFRIFFCALVYVAAGLFLKGVGRLQILLDVLLGVGAVVAIISLTSIGMDSHVILVHGTFGTHETLGSFLLLVLPLALPIAVTDLGDQRRQIFAQGVTLLTAAALLMAHTRASWLGSAVSLLVLAILYRLYGTQVKVVMSKAERAAATIGPPLILAAGIALFILTSQQASTFFSTASTLTHLNADDSARVRTQLAKGAIRMIKSKPILGWGPGTFPSVSYSYTGVGRTPDQIQNIGLTLDNNAHSFYLQFTAEEGLVGMAIFVVIELAFLLTAFLSLPSLSIGFRKCVVIGSVSASIGQLVDAAISPSYNLPTISMFVFLVFGIGVLAAKALDFSEISVMDPQATAGRIRQRLSPNTVNMDWAQQQDRINKGLDSGK